MPEQSVKLCECGCGEPAPIAKRTDPRTGSVKGQPLRFVHNHWRRDPWRWTVEDRGYSTPCWIWQGPTTPDGYSTQMVINGRHTKAHRKAWEDANGPIPDGLGVLHRCDVPSCIRADHLFVGTQADNMRDMRLKGRHARGEHSGRAKLTADDVAEIRALKGSLLQRELAERFGVSRPLISMIHAGRIWTDQAT